MKSKGSDAYGMLSSLGNKLKKVALNMSDIEIKVEEATSNEPWGPHGTLMGEISKAAYDWEQYRQVMGVIGRRLQSTGEDWRHVYKSLILLEYLLKHGPTRIIQELESSMSVLQKFHNFKYVDENGKDWGLNVRHRAKELTELVNNRERVEQERNKARALKSKYGGLSSQEARMGASSFRSRAYDDFDTNIEKAAEKFGEYGTSGGDKFGSSTTTKKKTSTYDTYDEYDPWPAKKERSSSSRDKGDSDGDRDPVEATKERIEALKLQGYLDEDVEIKVSRRESDAENKPPPRRVSPTKPLLKGSLGALTQAQEAEEKKPKRLSDFRVSSQIAASLGGLSFAPPPSAAAPAASSSAAAAPAPQVDLLGDLLGDATPAAAPSGGNPFNPQPPPGAAPGAATEGWGAFETDSAARSVAPAANQDDVWDAFSTERVAAAPVASAAAADPTSEFTAFQDAPPAPQTDSLTALLELSSTVPSNGAPTAVPAAATPLPSASSSKILDESFFSNSPVPAPPQMAATPSAAMFGAAQQGMAAFPAPQQPGMAAFSAGQPGMAAFPGMGGSMGVETMIQMGVQLPVGLNVAAPQMPILMQMPSGGYGMPMQSGGMVMFPGMQAAGMPGGMQPTGSGGLQSAASLGGVSGMGGSFSSRVDPMRSGNSTTSQGKATFSKKDPFDDLFK